MHFPRDSSRFGCGPCDRHRQKLCSMPLAGVCSSAKQAVRSAVRRWCTSSGGPAPVSLAVAFSTTSLNEPRSVDRTPHSNTWTLEDRLRPAGHYGGENLKGCVVSFSGGNGGLPSFTPKRNDAPRQGLNPRLATWLRTSFSIQDLVGGGGQHN